MFISTIVVNPLVVEGVVLLLSVLMGPFVVALDAFESSVLFVLSVAFISFKSVATKDVVLEISVPEVCAIGVVSSVDVASILTRNNHL